VCGVALVVVAFVALTALIVSRRKRTPPFLNYFYSEFNQDRFDRDNPSQGSFSGSSGWHSTHETRLRAYEAREAIHQNRR
jgi:hypothetical protein